MQKKGKRLRENIRHKMNMFCFNFASGVKMFFPIDSISQNLFFFLSFLSLSAFFSVVAVFPALSVLSLSCRNRNISNLKTE